MELHEWFKLRDVDSGIELLRRYGCNQLDEYFGKSFVPSFVLVDMENMINGLVEKRAKPIEKKQNVDKIEIALEIKKKHKAMAYFHNQLFSDMKEIRAMAASQILKIDKDLSLYYSQNRDETPEIAPKPAKSVESETISTTIVETVKGWMNEKKSLDKFFERVLKGKRGEFKQDNILPNFMKWEGLHHKLNIPFQKLIGDYVNANENV